MSILPHTDKETFYNWYYIVYAYYKDMQTSILQPV